MNDQPTPAENAPADSTSSASTTPGRPVLRVVSPDATPEEVAALVAVFSALGGEGAPAPRPVREWNSPYRQVRPFYSAGPGGWRSSGLPKHRGRGN